MRKISPTFLLFIVTLLVACTRERTETVVTPPPSATQATPAQVVPAQATPSGQPAPSASPTALAPHAAATEAEVKDKVARIFQGAAQVEPAADGGALVGDFNGDGSEDVAVFIKPDPARLEDFNSEVSLWILNDPHKVVLPDPNKDVQTLPKPEPVKVQAGDVLLAVIHGFQAQGWRNPEAQQTYVLKNVAGRELHVEPRQQVLTEYKQSAQRVRGDCIRAANGGDAGLIFFTGARYAWLPAKGSGQ